MKLASTLSLGLLLTGVATPALADGIVDNVNGVTMDKNGKLVRFTGIVVGSDGKVKKLLDKNDKRDKKGMSFIIIF